MIFCRLADRYLIGRWVHVGWYGLLSMRTLPIYEPRLRKPAYANAQIRVQQIHTSKYALKYSQLRSAVAHWKNAWLEIEASLVRDSPGGTVLCP